MDAQAPRADQDRTFPQQVASDARSRMLRIVRRHLTAEQPETQAASCAEALVDEIMGQVPAPPRGEQARLLGDSFARLSLETSDPALRGWGAQQAEQYYRIALDLERDTSPKEDPS